MSIRLALALTVWGIAAGGGFGYLAVHAAAPSPQADAPAHWPQGALLARRLDRATLVLLLHPECPCSRATVAELARLLPRLGDRVDAHVLFVVPPGLERAPQESALWRSVAEIPGATAHVDPAGRMASQLGALTSGQVLFYDASGDLRFAGGITPSRGHEGESEGARELQAAASGAGGSARAAVFGCSLLGEKDGEKR